MEIEQKIVKNINKKDNSKIKVIIPLILLVPLLILPLANAATIPDLFSSGASIIDGLLSREGAYPKAIDFVFFALLFISIYNMGAKYAFKEMKRTERAIVILLGLGTAYLLVLADISITFLVPYIHYIFYFLLLLLYWWLLRGIKNKFLRFILALLLSLATIALVSGVLDKLAGPKIPEISAPVIEAPKGFFDRIGNFFKSIFDSLGNALKSIKISPPGLPQITPPGITPPGAATTTSTTTITSLPSVPTPLEEIKVRGEGFGGLLKGRPLKYWWMPLAVLLVVLIVFFILKNLDKLKRRPKEPKEPKKAKGWEAEGEKAEIEIEEIIESIKKIIELKDNALNKLEEIQKKKEKLSDDLRELYHKAIRDRAYLRDKDSSEYKNLAKQSRDVAELIELEKELDGLLKSLAEEEDKLIGINKSGGVYKWFKGLITKYESRADEILEELRKLEPQESIYFSSVPERRKFWQRMFEAANRILRRTATEAGTVPATEAEPVWYRNALGRLYKAFEGLTTGGILESVRKGILTYYTLSKEEEKFEKFIEELTDIKKLRLYVENFERWKSIKDYGHKQLEEYFEKEKNFFYGGDGKGGFKYVVTTQIKNMKYMLTLIEFLEKRTSESVTIMQDLMVFKKEGDNFVDVTEDAADSGKGMPQNIPIYVAANFYTGTPPFEVTGFNIATIESVEGGRTVKRNVVKRALGYIAEQKQARPGAVLLKGVELGLEAGENKIVVVAKSRGFGYRRGGKKTITIYVKPIDKSILPKIELTIGVAPHFGGTVKAYYKENGEDKEFATTLYQEEPQQKRSEFKLQVDRETSIRLVAEDTNPTYEFERWYGSKIGSERALEFKADLTKVVFASFKPIKGANKMTEQDFERGVDEIFDSVRDIPEEFEGTDELDE